MFQALREARVDFANEGLRFSLDYNIDAWRPGVERRYVSYKEDVQEKEPARFWRWNFDQRSGWTFVWGMNIWDDELKTYIAGVFLFSNSKDSTAELAEKIFQSTCFEPNRKQQPMSQ